MMFQTENRTDGIELNFAQIPNIAGKFILVRKTQASTEITIQRRKTYPKK